MRKKVELKRLMHTIRLVIRIPFTIQALNTEIVTKYFRSNNVHELNKRKLSFRASTFKDRNFIKTKHIHQVCVMGL